MPYFFFQRSHFIAYNLSAGIKSWTLCAGKKVVRALRPSSRQMMIWLHFVFFYSVFHLLHVSNHYYLKGVYTFGNCQIIKLLNHNLKPYLILRNQSVWHMLSFLNCYKFEMTRSIFHMRMNANKYECYFNAFLLTTQWNDRAVKLWQVGVCTSISLDRPMGPFKYTLPMV